MASVASDRERIVDAAISGVLKLASETSGVQHIIEVKKLDDHSFSVIMTDGAEIHFSTSLF